MKLQLLFLVLSACALAENPSKVPSAFTTTKGISIRNARITSQNSDSIRLMHDGGIATIPLSQLPAEVLHALGLSLPPAKPEQAIQLPDPIKTIKAEYKSPELIAIEPDGLRIRHSLGSAKIKHEELPNDVIALVGPFDPKLAASFRQAQAERDREAYAAQRKAILESQNAIMAEAKAAEEKVDEHKQALLADPNLVSPSIFVELSAYSTGGKSRDNDWLTTWGSYSRTDTSSRQMQCAIASKINGYQRARIQCIFLTREVSGGKDLITEIVADDLVSLGPKAAKIVTASGEARQSDDRYALLGLRIREGVKYVGWCWRAIDGAGRVTAVYSSTPAYDRYGWGTPLN